MSKTSSLWNMKILSNWKLVPSWSLKTKSFSYSECNENDFKTFAWLEILCCLPILFHWSLSIPPGNIRKWKVFWYFQGVEKDIIDSKWVKISEMVNMKWNTKHERAKYKLLEVYWSQNTSFVRKSFKDFFVNSSRTFFTNRLSLFSYLSVIRNTLHKKWSFPLRISSVNVTNPQFPILILLISLYKTSVFVQWYMKN